MKHCPMSHTPHCGENKKRLGAVCPYGVANLNIFVVKRKNHHAISSGAGMRQPEIADAPSGPCEQKAHAGGKYIEDTVREIDHCGHPEYS